MYNRDPLDFHFRLKTYDGKVVSQFKFFIFITKTRLFKYIENFTPKSESFQITNSDIFHISAQNIDCGYLLEPPH